MKKINWLDHLINFVSVILGVSLAFYISDRANRQKVLQEKSYYISAIYTEIDEDISTFQEYQIPSNLAQMENIDKAIYTLATGEKMDSIDYFLGETFTVNNYAPLNNTFASMKSGGKTDLIDDFKLRGLLIDYLIESEEAQNRGDGQLDFYMDRLIPWYLDNIDLLSDFESLRKRQDFTVILSIYRGFIQNKIDKYEDLVRLGTKLKEKMGNSDLLLLVEDTSSITGS